MQYLYAAQQTAETLEAQARLGSRLVFSMHGQKTAVAKHTIAASAADEANVQLIATREDPARRAEQLRRVRVERAYGWGTHTSHSCAYVRSRGGGPGRNGGGARTTAA